MANVYKNAQGQDVYDVNGQTVNAQTGQPILGVQNVPSSQGVTPTNNLSTPASPMATPTPSSVASISPASIPTANLQPGMQGQNVAQFQSFLQSLGYLTPQQIATGPGVYGPQTKGAVSQLQQGLGINAGQYAGYYGPQTRQALQEKYKGIFDNLQKTNIPENGADARAALAETKQEDPQTTFLNSYFSMNPIVKNLYDTLNTTLSSANQKQSFVDEYNQLRTTVGIPELQTQFLNIKKIMRGTEDDIRNEIMKGGGTATESQVQAMVGVRNKVLLNQAQYLSDALQVQNDYVDQVMKFSGVDRDQVNKQLDRQIGLSEKMAEVQNTLNNAAKTNYQKVVDNLGYDGLANAIGNNPAQQRQVESLLGLRGGALSDPVWLERAKTFRQQQLGLAQGGMMRAVVDPLTGAITYYYSKPPAGGKAGPVNLTGGGMMSGGGIPTPTKAPSWLQSAIETAAGIQYIDATKLKGQAQQYQAQTWAANNNIAFLAPDDAKEVQKANQVYQSTGTLIAKIKDYSTKVLTAPNDKLKMAEQAARLYTIEYAPYLSNDNAAKEYISARNALVSIMTRSVGQEKGALANLDVARFYSALPGYSDNKELGQNKAQNLDDTIKSVFQGAISAYVINSGYKSSVPTQSQNPSSLRGKDGKIYTLQADGTYK